MDNIQDKEQERLAKTWDAAYKIYVKHPSQQLYDVMSKAFDELMEHNKKQGASND